MTEKAFVNCDFYEALATVRGGAPAAAYYAGASPTELNAIYSRGFRGVRPETVTTEQNRFYSFVRGKMPRLYEVFPWARGLGKGKINAPYLAILKFDSNFGGDEPQQSGCCTVHGAINAAMCDYAMDALFGETKWMGRLVKEVVWRSRGYNGDGWSCYAPTTWFGPGGAGGFLYRKAYTSPSGETLDFTKYSERWCSNGRAGVPQWLLEECQKSKAKWIIPIYSMEEYRDALAMGFGINICSGQGFSDTTDGNGVASARGSWSHSMGHLACIDTPWAWNKYGNMLGGIQQSWGRWNSQKGTPEGISKMSTGMFFAEGATIANRMLKSDDYAVCGVWGFERTGWELFDTSSESGVADMVDKVLTHLRDSTVQDYYKVRSERLQAHAEEAYHTFLAI